MIAVFPKLRVLTTRLKPVLSERVIELWHMPSEPIEVLVGLMLSGLGLVLILGELLPTPPGTVNYDTSNAWAVVRVVLPNGIAAGLILLAVSVIKFVGVLSKAVEVRRLGSMCATVVFLFIAGSFLVNAPFGIWLLLLFGAIASAWVFVRQGRPW